MKFTPVPEVLEAIRQGVPVVLVDDDNRENEGDLIVAAEKITAEHIAFMLHKCRGLICLSLPRSQLEMLRIPMQVAESRARFGTQFTVSVDWNVVAEHGYSAKARAATMRRLISAEACAADFSRPGYVFPLRASEGGVLQRRGQTEGSLDLARLAGLTPGAALCEILGPNGRVLRGKDLWSFVEEHKFPLTSVEEIRLYRIEHEISVRETSSIVLDESSKWQARSYVDDSDGEEHLALICGTIADPALVRIHSECLTGDLFGSRRCDCGFQLQSSIDQLGQRGGVLLYLNQEGRGIGLGNKLRAYALQDSGRDTVQANTDLGFAVDERQYRVAARILELLGVKRVSLLTNNPQKIESLEQYGIQVVERVGIHCEDAGPVQTYLQAKRTKMGHLYP